ncbi:transporter substrate-binding domain-containing protein [Paenibacillus piri]|uniref:Transporter substrate-binding domain-containing protein n=1 Tax=Paenibacillus piri TaxID=2547395 RepID=A0A4R5KNX9_9BACL|nr:transporter substrate-binding domain-containing protein [Paenibacillus piri]TDF97276.1 transporter substrate-binding domain-containing protein [Paenibacillus piri]
MKKNRRIGISFALTIMMIVLVLAGCGSTAPAPGPGTDASKSNGGADSSGQAAASTLDAIKKRGKLIAGVKFDTKLFGLKDPGSGKVEGFDIDLAKALAKQILGDESKIELKEVTSKTRIPMLNNGDIDIIIATMTITEERKKEVEFTDVYFKAGQSLLVKKGSPIKSVADVKKGVKVLAVKGSTSTTNIRAKSPEATVLEFENYQEAFTALKAGQGDTLTTDNAILYGMVKQDPNYEVVGGTFTDEPYGMAIKKGDTTFASYVNDFLKSLQSNGQYEKLYEQWIGEKPTK